MIDYWIIFVSILGALAILPVTILSIIAKLNKAPKSGTKSYRRYLKELGLADENYELRKSLNEPDLSENKFSLKRMWTKNPDIITKRRANFGQVSE